ncbi:Hint domain-containing protein [Seohaeicola saemankumensis]|nr:Hint domain-containing protein [Seohaeicola saemankumensis]
MVYAMNKVLVTRGDDFSTGNSAQQNSSALNWMRAGLAENALDQACSVHIHDASTAVSDAELVGENSGIMCFAAGTRMSCKGGLVPIEHLKVGDLVMTMDQGYQPIRWIGTKHVPATGKFAPVRFRKGVLTNVRDLLVCPQHRMLLSGWQAELLFGESEVLVAAQHLVNDGTITRIEGGDVAYYQMLFDTHEIVFAEGCPAESLHLEPQNWDRLSQVARLEILTLFPELANNGFRTHGASARMTLKARDAMVLCMQCTDTSDLRLAG